MTSLAARAQRRKQAAGRIARPGCSSRHRGVHDDVDRRASHLAHQDSHAVVRGPRRTSASRAARTHADLGADQSLSSPYVREGFLFTLARISRGTSRPGACRAQRLASQEGHFLRAHKRRGCRGLCECGTGRLLRSTGAAAIKSFSLLLKQVYNQLLPHTPFQ